MSEKILRRELGNKEAQEAHIKGLVDEVKLELNNCDDVEGRS